MEEGIERVKALTRLRACQKEVDEAIAMNPEDPELQEVFRDLTSQVAKMKEEVLSYFKQKNETLESGSMTNGYKYTAPPYAYDKPARARTAASAGVQDDSARAVRRKMEFSDPVQHARTKIPRITRRKTSGLTGADVALIENWHAKRGASRIDWIKLLEENQALRERMTVPEVRRAYWNWQTKIKIRGAPAQEEPEDEDGEGEDEE